MKTILKNALAVGRVVPVQILASRKMIFPYETGQTGLPYLSGATDKNHFIADIRKNVRS
jgi:hypothetical protein